MRYRLRTLLILLAILPPLIAWIWFGYGQYQKFRERQRLLAEQARMDWIVRILSASSAPDSPGWAEMLQATTEDEGAPQPDAGQPDAGQPEAK